MGVKEPQFKVYRGLAHSVSETEGQGQDHGREGAAVQGLPRPGALGE